MPKKQSGESGGYWAKMEMELRRVLELQLDDHIKLLAVSHIIGRHTLRGEPLPIEEDEFQRLSNLYPTIFIDY